MRSSVASLYLSGWIVSGQKSVQGVGMADLIFIALCIGLVMCAIKVYMTGKRKYSLMIVIISMLMGLEYWITQM